jgi:hypothetical protein
MQKLMRMGAAMLVVLCATMVFAADVTGTWATEMKTPDGNSFSLSFTFKQDGAKLTGSVTGPQGDPIDISNGKIDGDKLSFDVEFNGSTIKHDGVINGDEIKLTTKSDNPDFPGMEMTLKRGK